MTLSINIEIAEDLFEANDIIRLTRPTGTCMELAGIRFETHAGARESREMVRRICFNAALKQIRDAWPQLSVWLFACHSAWQHTGKVPLYRRLWRSLERANVVLPSGERAAEVPIESALGVRFFGVVQVPAEEYERAYNVLAEERGSFIVASTTGCAARLDEYVLAAWQRDQGELLRLAELAAAVCGEGRVIFRPFGFFDDVEVGVDVILEPALLKQWNSTMT